MSNVIFTVASIRELYDRIASNTQANDNVTEVVGEFPVELYSQFVQYCDKVGSTADALIKILSREKNASINTARELSAICIAIHHITSELHKQFEESEESNGDDESDESDNAEEQSKELDEFAMVVQGVLDRADFDANIIWDDSETLH